MGELEDRMAKLEKSEGLTEQEKAFLELPPEVREDFLKITQRVLEYCYNVFVKRHPQLKSLRYNIFEHRDRERPIVSKLTVDKWLERLSQEQREEFAKISEGVKRALINEKDKN